MNDVLSVEEQQNVCGSKCRRAKAWLVSCLLPPHGASRTADRGSNMFFTKLKSHAICPRIYKVSIH